MARIVVFSLCLLLTVKTITCIDCYSCVSTEDPDCLDPENHLKRRKCDSDGLLATSQYATKLDVAFKQIFEVPIAVSAIPLNCLKQTVRVGGTDVVFRGCQLPKDPNGLDVCSKIHKSQNPINVNVQHCSLCDTDGCNSAPSIRLAPLATAGTMILCVLVAVF